jgi:hypothetical protein
VRLDQKARKAAPTTKAPQHKVRIGVSVGVGKFAVTFDEWDACVSDWGPRPTAPSTILGGGRRPVINVCLV